MSSTNSGNLSGSEIAIVGMACQFPGARDVAEFWQNLAGGVETFHTLTDEELDEAGVSEESYRSPAYVRVSRSVEGADTFDAAFFGISPREAEIIDPQQRKFLECAWHALENAGYDPGASEEPIGLFGGGSTSVYLRNVYSHPEIIESVGDFQAQISNHRDYLITRIAYKLDLKGPAMTVQTACSTSLVATHLACQSLISGECGIALAGGISLRIPQRGYPYKEGEILSSDGHVRAFDAKANGTIFGNGWGIVVLKTLADALADGDTIHAVIRATAVNNDGSTKVGFAAPSPQGQIGVLRAAQALAEVHPETITSVETHGTGTSTGDPIEIEALTSTFREHTERKGFCAIGSVKTNIGHMGSAAGVAGLIKTSLMLEHRQIPPSLNFEEPNPKIDFDSSPFFVNTELRDWSSDGAPRRAGVSSFGVGGTNAHAILEQAPDLPPTSPPSRPLQLLMLSTRSEKSLERATERLVDHFTRHPDLDLADACYTLKVGRRSMEHRRFAVCRDLADATAVLGERDPKRLRSGRWVHDRPSVCFLFSGQGSQYPQMGRHLYGSEPVFRRTVDQAAEALEPLLGLDLRRVLYPPAEGEAEAERQLEQTRLSQPALFTVEMALARLWRSWGIEPEAMIGHSIGEYSAACLAGVFGFEEGLRLVAARGRLMQSLPPGAMLSVPLPEDEVAPMLDPQLSIAVINAPNRCVVSGPDDAIAALERRLAERQVAVSRLHTSHAFHSPMMEPILEPFLEEVGKVALAAPQIPYISNVTGTWITPQEAMDPEYWAHHIRRTVRFADALEILLGEEERILLEVGPGKTLQQLAQRHPQKGPGHTLLSSLRHPKEKATNDLAFLLETLGFLWLTGVEASWSGFYGEERRRRIPLPGYPFAGDRFFIEYNEENPSAGSLSGRRKDLGEWFALPSWRPSPALSLRPMEEAEHWLLFTDSDPLSPRLDQRLAELGQERTEVRPGDGYRKLGVGRYEISPAEPADYDRLFADLEADERLPRRIVHLWNVGEPAAEPAVEAIQERGFYSLLFTAQALGQHAPGREVDVLALTDGMVPAALDRPAPGEPEERLFPEKATLLGPCFVMSLEYPGLCCASADFLLPASDGEAADLVDQLIAEALAPEPSTPIAYRFGQRWTRHYENVRIGDADPERMRLRQGGSYLITGGLGGFGLTFARFLADEYQARLTLIGRSALPPEEVWDDHLAAHGAEERTSRKLLALREIEKLGGEVLYLGADVTDAAAVAAAVGRARERFGAFDGVIHAAGLPGGGMMQLKTREMAAQVIAPKLHGTLALERALAGETLDFFALQSSTIAVLGPVGQVDYCGANHFLDAFAECRFGRSQLHPVSINWTGWEEVGMAAEARAQMEARAAGEPAAEPWAPATPAAEPPTPERPAALAPAPETLHFLIDRRLESDGEEAIYVTDFDPRRHWMLDEHRIAGQPAMPGTTHLELARAAFAEETGHCGGFEIREAVFFQPLMVPAGGSKEGRVVLRPGTGRAGGLDFTVITRDGEDWTHHAQGKIAALGETARRRNFDLAAIIDRCGEHIEVDYREGRDPQRLVQWGPRWESLVELHRGEGETLAKLTLPPAFLGDLEHFVLHPALLDVATALTGALGGGDSYLPLAYRHLKLHASLPAVFYSYVRTLAGERGSETVSARISLLDEAGDELVTIEEFTMKRVGTARQRLETEAASSSPSPDAAALTSGRGIRPQEGVEILRRILSLVRQPRIIVSVQDIASRRQQMLAALEPGAGEKKGAASSSHARPDLPTPYTEPRNDVERRLAEIWQQVLGLEQVGIHDEFFMLGGDSVLGMQIVLRGREAGLEIQPQQIFESPTIAELAAVLTPEEEPAGAAAPELPSAALVAIRGAGAEPPVFCLHHIGGDVEPYQELARALGDDQPVYALRSLPPDPAAGVPTVEEMVAGYLREVRDVRPQGPYRIVGWSMGGVLALEMARSLFEDGQEVFLGVIDVPPPGIYAWAEVLDDTALLSLMLGEELSLDNLKLSVEELRKLADLQALEKVFRVSQQTVILPREGGPDVGRQWQVVLRNFRSLAAHRPRVYEGPVLFLEATASPWREFDQDAEGWDQYLPAVRREQVDGDHYSVIRSPNVERIAALLREGMRAFPESRLALETA